MSIEVDNLSCGYGKNVILKDINLELNTGETLTILGPNGVGKTTLFKTILGLIDKIEGDIRIQNEDISKISRKDLAKLVAYVPQAHVPPFPFKVIDVVSMGRTPHVSNFSGISDEDKKVSEDAIEKLGISYLKDYVYTEISGGERQMVLIARAIAQQSEFLVLDEPTSNLDFGNQAKIIKIINDLSKSGKGIIMTSHFPDHVFRGSDKVLAMGRDNFLKLGTPNEVINSKVLEKLYGIEAFVEKIDIEKRIQTKICIPFV